MKFKMLVSALAVGLLLGSYAMAAKDGFVPLFDGKSLDGCKQLGGKA